MRGMRLVRFFVGSMAMEFGSTVKRYSIEVIDRT
jgi:hypothetical protein